MYLYVQCPLGHSRGGDALEVYRKNQKHKKSRRAGPNQRGKQCWGKCGERLTFKSFGKNVTKPDGLKDYCHDCETRYRQDRKHTYTRFLERYRLLAGIKRNYRTFGWRKRYTQLRATGRARPSRHEKAKKDRANIRLVCGELMICKPRKGK